jgi:hypothetical protein
LKQQCPNGHSQAWQCHQGASAPVTCVKCERERKEAEKKARKALEAQQRRDAEDEKHRKEVAKLQEEIDRVTQDMKDGKLNAERQAFLAQLRSDLVAQKERANRVKVEPSPQISLAKVNTQNHDMTASAISSQPVASSSRPKKASKRTDKLQGHLKICLDHNDSPAQTEWQRQKDQENASNPAVDKIMEMIGLEDVKSQVLRIKAKVETSLRQGTDLSKERLGLVLLGNPGTGKFYGSSYYVGDDSDSSVCRQNHSGETLCASTYISTSPLRRWLC